MVATAGKERELKEKVSLTALPLSQPTLKPKTKLNRQKVFVVWTNKIALSFCLFITWCLVNALILLETKSCNWGKRQIYAEEMKLQQLQAKIVARLFELTANSASFHSSQLKPTLLIVGSHARKQSLLGRR